MQRPFCKFGKGVTVVRKLMWFTIGFAAACAVCAYLLDGLWPLLLGIAGLVGGVMFLLQKRTWQKVCGVILIGCFVGFSWNYLFQIGYTDYAKQLDGQTVQTDVLISDYSYQTDKCTVADGRVNYHNRSYQVRLYIYDDITLKPGDRVQAQCRFRYTARGGDDEQTYHSGKGIFLLAYANEDYTYNACQKIPVRFFAAQLRHQLIDALERSFPEDTAPFARALLLGDSSTLRYSVSRALTVSGIRHVIAVSGLHVSVLFSLLWILCFRRVKLVALIGFPVLFIFAAVAGFTPSVVRACIMQALMVLAEVFLREYDRPTALAFSVLVLLGVNPMCITDVGFQLTVSCMIGIIAFYRPLYEYLMAPSRLGTKKKKGIVNRIHKWVAATVSISLSTLLTTAPLCAIYFGAISVVAILANLLTIWLILYIFCGIIAVCVLAFIWQPAACACAWVLSWGIRYVQQIAMALGELPFAAVYTCNVYTIFWLIFSYLLVILFFIAKKKRPVILAGAILGCLAVSCALSWTEGKNDNFRVTVLDVGQGQCILLGNHKSRYLVDCGGDSGRIVADQTISYLNSRGIFWLDGVILTHYDDDHASGVPYLLDKLQVGQVILPDMDDDNSIRLQLESDHAHKIYWMMPNTVRVLSDAQITLACGREERTDNESGICVLFQPENCDILITGDRNLVGEKDLLKQLDLPKLELLVAGHHGSGNATGLSLLQTTRPDTVVISVGDNSYGHPAPQLLERLADYSCRVLRTDKQGTIVFRG